MRTKLILTTAALGISSLGALAQVYSVNAVGYINVTVPANKLAAVANQLNAGDNSVNAVIPTAPDGTIIYTYAQATGFDLIQREFGDWGPKGATAGTLAPGKGVFIANNSATDLVITFVGEVPQGALSTALSQGLNLVGSQVPQAGALSGALGYTAADGDQVYQWNVGTQAYNNPSSFEFGAWGPSDPNIAVGEGFFLSKSGAGTWNRTFSVNP
jgi:hypothetical protein